MEEVQEINEYVNGLISPTAWSPGRGGAYHARKIIWNLGTGDCGDILHLFIKELSRHGVLSGNPYMESAQLCISGKILLSMPVEVQTTEGPYVFDSPPTASITPRIWRRC